MLRRAIVAGIVLAALAAPASAAASARVGAFPNEAGGITVLEQQLGQTVAVDHSYVPWDFTSWQRRVAGDVATGRTPMLSWSAAPKTTASAIASGSQDARIDAAAAALKATGITVFLRPFYEFDQPVGHPRYIGTPAQVIAAWQHLFDRFQADGATNVKFVWCPMAFDYPKGVAQEFWPGGQYVHYVAADGYNFPGRKWRSFGTIFQGAYDFAVAQGKRFIVAETASPATDPRTPAWIADASQWAQVNTDVAAIVYFDSVSPKGYDFRLQPNASVFGAYQSWLALPYFAFSS
jgi:hypothetical protein